MNSTDTFHAASALAGRLLPGALLILPGFTLVGVAIGQMFNDPSNWTTVGLGMGAAVWGISLSLSARRTGK